MDTANVPVDPWVVQSAKQHEPLPVGMYMGIFQGVETVTLKGTGETRWRWTWCVSAGALKGKVATALTDQTINPNTLAGRLTEGLLGRPIVVGDHVKTLVDACVTKVYMLSIQTGPQGGKPGVRAVSQPPAM